MITEILIKKPLKDHIKPNDIRLYKVNKINVIKGMKKALLYVRVIYHLFKLAINVYGSFKTAVKALKLLKQFKVLTMGRSYTKVIKVEQKYYFHLFAPGYPSKIFDEYILGELNRVVPISKKTDDLNYLYLAITKKCPLNCEHCFEWDNLNKKESLELIDLKAIVERFQREGISQFHLSGGEPMARIKDLNELILLANKVSEFYVLTSGFNFTASNAALLKQSGLTGVVISLDHFDAEKHDAFRGFQNSFDQVMQAIENAKNQKLVTALTLCATKEFISWENLIEYAMLAKKQGVVFVQLLEPKAVGHYKEKEVLLSIKDINLLDKFYETMNFDKNYEDFPIVIYPGYHQRKVGCMSGGNRTLYIDSEGYVNACPFCQTKNFNIKNIIDKENQFMQSIKSSVCPSVTVTAYN